MADAFAAATCYASAGQAVRFTDAKDAFGGGSDSNAKRFLAQCVSLGILRHEEVGKRYVKVEGMEKH